MKSFLLKSAVFLIFFLAFSTLVNLLFLVIIIKTDLDFVKRLESLKFKDPDFDVLILGASTALDGFDAELLTSNGFKAYNLALGGGSIRTNLLQLEEYLGICSEMPEYVIIGLNSQLVKTFDDDGINPIVEVTSKDYKFGVKDIPIVKFHWLGTEFLKRLVSKDIRQASLKYGQLRTKRTRPDHTEFKQKAVDLQKYESSYWLGKLTKVCQDYSIRLMIIEMPGFQETRNISSTGPYKVHFSNGNHADLYNFNSIEFCEIFNSSEDWLGNSHLNLYGAEKFTSAIIPYLIGTTTQKNGE